MGEAVLFLTKHCFVPPSGHTWMYAPGLHEAGTAQCNVFTSILKGHKPCRRGCTLSLIQITTQIDHQNIDKGRLENSFTGFPPSRE